MISYHVPASWSMYESNDQAADICANSIFTSLWTLLKHCNMDKKLFYPLNIYIYMKNAIRTNTFYMSACYIYSVHLCISKLPMNA